MTKRAKNQGASKSKKAATKQGTPRKATKKASRKSPANAAKTTKAPKANRRQVAASAPKAAPQARPSALNAAAQVLRSTGKPMNCRAMIATMAERGLWTSPGGKTPHATLYAAIIREIAAKGSAARFKKVERGQFAFNGGGK